MTQAYACGLLKPHTGAPSTPVGLNKTFKPQITTVTCTLNLGPLPHTLLDEGSQQDLPWKLLSSIQASGCMTTMG